LDYHIDSLELAKLSADANVGTLMLTHQVPALSTEQARIYFTGPMQRHYKGELIVSEDGTRKVLDL
jgi:ribonuclease BN (tRNA processing enzyme)